MGMNDEQLTPTEHDDLRARLLSGAKRIRPVGAHRRAIVTTTLAVVLVAGLSGGALGAANLLRMDGAVEPVATPTPSATPTPTPTPIPTPPDAPLPAPPAPTASLGLMPFGGACANALDDEEASSAAGEAMQLSDYRWQTGANAVAGGIDCIWVSTEQYLSATVSVYAYPDSEVSADVKAVSGTGCEPTADGTRIICDASGVQDGMWVLVRATGWADKVSPDGVQSAFAAVTDRLGRYPAGRRADATPAWWGALDCDALPASLDPSRYGFDRVRKLDYSADAPVSGAHPSQVIAAAGGRSIVLRWRDSITGISMPYIP